MNICILIPGIGGSKIYCNCDEMKGVRLYPPRKFFNFYLNKHFYTCTSVRTKIFKSHFNISIYRKCIKSLGCNTFSYDWRDDVLENTKKMIDYIKEVQRKIDNVRITLVGHSLGGLMIRIAVEYLNMNINYIKNIYICGTPFYGSKYFLDYNAERQILPKLFNNSIKLKGGPMIFSRHDVNKIFKTFPLPLLYLIPTHELEGLDHYDGVSTHKFQIIKLIHYTLGQNNFPGDKIYHFYFNVSNCTTVTNTFEYKSIDMFIHESDLNNVWRKGNTLIFRHQKRGDGVVVPFTFLPNNAIILYDTSWIKHSMLLNSKYLRNFIKTQ